jgi:PAS domain-containing protein
MQASRELRLWLGVLVAMQLVLAFGAVRLLGRVGPAVERTESGPLTALMAVQEMLAAAAVDGLPTDERLEAFGHALAQAQAVVTDADGQALLDAVAAQQKPALTGDTAARQRLVQQLQQFGQTRRGLIARASSRARRLSGGGAWAVVLLSLCTLTLSLLAAARLQRRLLAPVAEMHGLLASLAQGDRYRRWVGRRRSPEFEHMGEALNNLLDEHWPRAAAARQELAELDRAALLALMDAASEPIFLVNASGALAAMNSAARARYDQDQGEGWQQVGQRLAQTGSTWVDGLQVTPLADRGWLCRATAEPG